MAAKEISAKTAIESEGGVKEFVEAKCTYDLGNDLEDAKGRFGEKVVQECYEKGAVLAIQAVIRRLLLAGKTQEEIDTYFKEYVLGANSSISKDPKIAMIERFKGMSAEEKEAFIAELQAKLS